MFCFEEFKHSSSCIPKCNSFYLILRWWYVILDNFFSCFMIHKLSRMRYLNPSYFLRSWYLFNPTISSLMLSWYRFHLKPSRRFVANYGAYKWPKFFIYPLGEINFSSPCSYPSNLLFSLVAEFHLKFWDVSISPRRSYPFFVFFQQLRSIHL